MSILKNNLTQGTKKLSVKHFPKYCFIIEMCPYVAKRVWFGWEKVKQTSCYAVQNVRIRQYDASRDLNITQ